MGSCGTKIQKEQQDTLLLRKTQTIDSSILSKEETETLLSLFDEHRKFHDLNRQFKFEAIYSSQHHGRGETIFKQLCHSQKHLLCIIETKDDNVFGGYTANGWTRYETEKGRGLEDYKAFIFSVRSNNKYPPAIFNKLKKKNKAYIDGALWQQTGYFCAFGGNCAFRIDSEGNTGACNGKKCLNFDTYPHDHYLTGGWTFYIENIEVFQLT
eukprot:1986_1